MNPYEPPSQNDFIVGSLLRFDETLLVAEKDSALPAICVSTGQRIDSGMLSWRRLTTSMWGDVRIRSCRLYYGLSPNERRRYRRRELFIRVYQLTTFLTFVGVFATGNWDVVKPWLPIAIAPVCLLSAAVYSIPTDPLRIERYDNGRFWIAGICVESRRLISAMLKENATDATRSGNQTRKD
ncbi:MAG: hypothetical protein IT422_15055 [Pirellulaceae bacterium]|nr:hypothetical protein [Pirellulaceae bacterium]